MPDGRDRVVELYRRDNDLCNRQAFDELTPFRCDVVVVNGTERTAQGYIDDLSPCTAPFPTTGGRCSA